MTNPLVAVKVFPSLGAAAAKINQCNRLKQSNLQDESILNEFDYDPLAHYEM